mmetsp:Transcript_3847/g.12433  ORF Transcript_3847/g.12433 Transcript_3847/m.12433 type:complete len:242 (+) Transcript_3847:1868-2593(+)
MSLQQVVGDAQFGAEAPHVILEEGSKGLQQAERERGGKPANVVVLFDVAVRLDDVRVDGALAEDGGTLLLGEAGENSDELSADDTPLLLGVRHAVKCVEKVVSCVDARHVEVQPCKLGHDLVVLVLAQQAVVDKAADDAVLAEGTGDEGEGDGRVDAARAGDEDTLVVCCRHLVADGDECRLQDARGRKGRSDLGNLGGPAGNHFDAACGVAHLGVEEEGGDGHVRPDTHLKGSNARRRGG